MEIKWLGHASWMLKAAGKIIYIDPYEGEYHTEGGPCPRQPLPPDHCKEDKLKAGRRTLNSLHRPSRLRQGRR